MTAQPAHRSYGAINDVWIADDAMTSVQTRNSSQHPHSVTFRDSDFRTILGLHMTLEAVVDLRDLLTTIVGDDPADSVSWADRQAEDFQLRKDVGAAVAESKAALAVKA